MMLLCPQEAGYHTPAQPLCMLNDRCALPPAGSQVLQGSEDAQCSVGRCVKPFWPGLERLYLFLALGVLSCP